MKKATPTPRGSHESIPIHILIITGDFVTLLNRSIVETVVDAMKARERVTTRAGAVAVPCASFTTRAHATPAKLGEHRR